MKSINYLFILGILISTALFSGCNEEEAEPEVKECEENFTGKIEVINEIPNMSLYVSIDENLSADTLEALDTLSYIGKASKYKVKIEAINVELDEGEDNPYSWEETIDVQTCETVTKKIKINLERKGL